MFYFSLMVKSEAIGGTGKSFSELFADPPQICYAKCDSIITAQETSAESL